MKKPFTQEEKDKLYNTLCYLAHEIDQLQDTPLGRVADTTRQSIDFLINPTE